MALLRDRIASGQRPRDTAKSEFPATAGREDWDKLAALLSTIAAQAPSVDPWTSRARPAFLYVMYALLLWSIPMGIIAAFQPDMAQAITSGMHAYLSGIPDPLYALFGTGYLGYTAARSWGKARGTET